MLPASSSSSYYSSSYPSGSSSSSASSSSTSTTASTIEQASKGVFLKSVLDGVALKINNDYLLYLPQDRRIILQISYHKPMPILCRESQNTDQLLEIRPGDPRAYNQRLLTWDKTTNEVTCASNFIQCLKNVLTPDDFSHLEGYMTIIPAAESIQQAKADMGLEITVSSLEAASLKDNKST